MAEDIIPNPGSPKALGLGCECPYLDNHKGKGIIQNGMVTFWINEECPLHGKRTTNENDND